MELKNLKVEEIRIEKVSEIYKVRNGVAFMEKYNQLK